jgi:hypothetical protein
MQADLYLRARHASAGMQRDEREILGDDLAGLALEPVRVRSQPALDQVESRIKERLDDVCEGSTRASAPASYGGMPG